jgi:uncharacterized membrane protein YfcA
METNFIVFVIVGFLAQMIDGALGMAYGVSSNTFLLSLGIPLAAASASVHMAEVVTTGISGFSHWKLGNVNWSLVKRLLIPGVIGGVAGHICSQHSMVTSSSLTFPPTCSSWGSSSSSRRST